MMPYYEFVWNDETIDHLDEHGISPEDFENVVCRPTSVSRSRSSGLPAAFGYASDGRYLIAVYKILDEMIILPVTAYEVNEP